MRLVSAIYNDFYPFDLYFPEAELEATRNPDDLREGDVLIVWGGEDISPALYNRKVSRQTGAQNYPSMRDHIEWGLMQRAKELGLPIVGICRGAQMLCALAGGFLVQHVNGHGGRHTVITYDDVAFSTNSIHHQMQYPFDIEHKLVGWTEKKLSDVYVDEDRLIEVNVEPEFVHYTEVKGFGVQWHPEMMEAGAPATEYVVKYIKDNMG